MEKEFQSSLYYLNNAESLTLKIKSEQNFFEIQEGEVHVAVKKKRISLIIRMFE